MVVTAVEAQITTLDNINTRRLLTIDSVLKGGGNIGTTKKNLANFIVEWICF